MNKLKLIGLASLLATGIAHASSPCEGFQVKIKNNLADNLYITSFDVNGAKMDHEYKLSARGEQNLTVTESAEGVPVRGKVFLYTLSVPAKEVSIRFVLFNDEKAGKCIPLDLSSSSNHYAVEATQGDKEVVYSITNK